MTNEPKSMPELQDVQNARSDPSHPDHEKAINDDPAWIAKRDAVYQKAYGTEEQLPADLQKMKENLEREHGTADEPQEAEQLTPELGAMKSAYEQRTEIPDDLDESGKLAIDMLKREWGEDFDANYRTTFEVLRTVPHDQLEALSDDYEGLANDPDLLTVLADIGVGKWGEISPALLQRLEDRYPGIADDERIADAVEQIRARFYKPRADPGFENFRDTFERKFYSVK